MRAKLSLNLFRHSAANWMCGLLIAAGVGVTFFGVPSRSQSVRSDELSSSSTCVARDRAASEAVAELVYDSSAVAEWKLDQAILQLRRARKYCRSGSVQVALHDYASLQRNLPLRRALLAD